MTMQIVELWVTVLQTNKSRNEKLSDGVASSCRLGSSSITFIQEAYNPAKEPREVLSSHHRHHHHHHHHCLHYFYEDNSPLSPLGKRENLDNFLQFHILLFFLQISLPPGRERSRKNVGDEREDMLRSNTHRDSRCPSLLFLNCGFPAAYLSQDGVSTTREKESG